MSKGEPRWVVRVGPSKRHMLKKMQPLKRRHQDGRKHTKPLLAKHVRRHQRMLADQKPLKSTQDLVEEILEPREKTRWWARAGRRLKFWEL